MKSFVKRADADGILVELGSGNRRLRDDCINVDIFPFQNVDILADIVRIPFGNDTVRSVVIDAVLEHVPEPHAVVDEIYRIVAPGGKVFCVVPFIHSYHGYPKNYFNISKDGISYLFRRFRECEIGCYRGPTSAIISLIAEYFATALSGNKRGILYKLSRAAALLPIFSLKYLDRFWCSRSSSVRISNALYVLATK